MLTLSRLLLLSRCNYISRSKGVFEECVANIKSVHFKQRLNLYSTVQTADEPVVKQSYQDPKSKNYFYSTAFNQLLSLIKGSHRDINKCLPALNRMISIYYTERPDSKLSFDLKLFLMSKDFEKFCESLHRHLPHLKPDALVNLLIMEHFGVPVNSVLMQKVLVLILDNINSYSAFDKVFIHATISTKYYENSEQCAALKKALDVYFEKVFDQEIEHQKCDLHMLPLMRNANVPVKVKKKLAEKIIREVILTRGGFSNLRTYLEAILIQPIPLFSPSETIDLLKKANRLKPTGMVGHFIHAYKNLLQMDDSFYDESFCNDLSLIVLLTFNKNLIKLANYIILLGHLNDDLVKAIAERSAVLNFENHHVQNILNLASIFARSCARERNILEPEKWEGIKMEFETQQFTRGRISYLHLHLCEFLTFLGCETRNLFTVIFDAIEQNKFGHASDPKYCILRFHHLAKAYFSKECAVLSNETLSRIMEESAVKNNSFPATLVDFIGGEDYLLRNCTTPDKHFLHYVAVLGPDNKPINLSSFKQKTTPATHSEKYLYNIEDIKRPSGSKLVIFQNFLDTQPIKFYNAPVMSGMAKIYLKSFEALNHDVVLLPSKLSSEYLRSQLNEIVEKREEKK